MTAPPEAFYRLLGDVRAHLTFLSDIGCNGMDCSPQALRTIRSWQRPPRPASEPLSAVLDDIRDCRRCRLCGRRSDIVPGAGQPGARLMIIGKSPGMEEDAAGEPFVGPAGRLLEKIIEAIRLSRDMVYLCDVVKCRPPEDRNPTSEEIAACIPFLHRQIRAVNPDFICVLGSVAARALLNTREPISLLHGRFQRFGEIPVMPTYHPSQLLKNSEKKRDVWEDMKKLMAAMGISL